MFLARLSPHLAGVWQCKAKSLLIRAIGEIRGSNCRSQDGSESGSGSFPSAGGASDDRPRRQPGFPRPTGRSPSGTAKSLKLPATRFPFEASRLRGFSGPVLP